MTAIVGWIDKEHTVWMGADSASSANNSIGIREDKKLFKLGEMAIGYCGSPRVGQIIKWDFWPPKHPKSMVNEQYIVLKVVPEMRKALARNDYLDKEPTKDIESQFLIGYRGQLFTIWGDFQVEHQDCVYAAIGSGCDLAQGALYVMARKVYVSEFMHATEILECALSAAVAHTPFVRDPFWAVNTSDDCESLVRL